MESTEQQLNILIQLAESDKHFAKSERELIFHVAKMNGVAESRVAEIIRHPTPIGNLTELSKKEKLSYLLSCIHLIFADQKVFESEITFCKTIAEKLGFKKNSVDYLIGNLNHLEDEEVTGKVFEDYSAS